MAHWTAFSEDHKRQARAIIDILMIGVLWSVSSVGYYRIKDIFGLSNGYKEAPFTYAAYYLGFSVLAAILFRHRLRAWHTPAHSGLPILAVLGMIAVFTLGVLPNLPKIDMSHAPLEPPEFMFANALYYFAKSFEILFQQALILTLVLVFSSFGWRMLRIELVTALLFGLFHFTLIFDGFTGFYVARFTIAATCFGAIVPTLMLSTRNGVTLSYALHWGFYAVDNVFTHLMLSASS